MSEEAQTELAPQQTTGQPPQGKGEQAHLRAVAKTIAEQLGETDDGPVRRISGRC